MVITRSGMDTARFERINQQDNLLSNVKVNNCFTTTSNGKSSWNNHTSLDFNSKPNKITFIQEVTIKYHPGTNIKPKHIKYQTKFI